MGGEVSQIMKVVILAVSKGKKNQYFCIVNAGHLSICSQNNPMPFFALLHGKELHSPGSLALASGWVPPIRGNIRGLGVSRQALILLPFLHLLCGSTSDQSVHGFIGPDSFSSSNQGVNRRFQLKRLVIQSNVY